MSTDTVIQKLGALWVTQPSYPRVALAMYMKNWYLVIEDHRPVLRVISLDGDKVIYVASTQKLRMQQSAIGAYPEINGGNSFYFYEIADKQLIRISCTKPITPLDTFVAESLVPAVTGR
jgi:hypothetical protein